MTNVLVVDDQETIRILLKKMLQSKGFDCTLADGAAQAKERLAEKEFELMLSDVNMPPGVSGLELIKDVKEDYPDLATIMVTGVDDPNLADLALTTGAYGYIIKPFKFSELLINISNALIRRKLEMENKNHREKLEEVVQERTKKLQQAVFRLQSAKQQLRVANEEGLNRLMRAAEFRDNETAQHIQRMSRYSELLYRCMGKTPEECEDMRASSPMHDIGKIGIPDNILLKPGKLTDEEFIVMKGHPDIGYRILTGSGLDILEMGAIIARTHHEKFDGSGYPMGLAGEDIPEVGRVVAIADVFDALTSRRVYKKAFSIDDSVEFMKKYSGSHFDPKLIDSFFLALPDILNIKSQFPDD